MVVSRTELAKKMVENPEFEKKLYEFYDRSDEVWEKWEEIERTVWKEDKNTARRIVDRFMDASDYAEDNEDFETAYKILEELEKEIEELKKKYLAGAPG